MFLCELDFELPDSRIAQAPTGRPEDAKLLVVRRHPKGGLTQFESLRISDLPQLISEETELKKALWLRNRSPVIKARFYALRDSGARHEIVLVEDLGKHCWKALIRNSAKLKTGEVLRAESRNDFTLKILSKDQIDLSANSLALSEFLEKHGEMPLPPYIKDRNPERDIKRYQPSWAKIGQGQSVAAPTASLHFSDSLVKNLETIGIEFADVFLNVGLGTFEPLRNDVLEENVLHGENFFVAENDYFKIDESLNSKRPVLCVGTTALRVLESLYEPSVCEIPLKRLDDGILHARTRIFLHPNHPPKKTSFLLTNFHLPQSSLFALVCGFAGSTTLAKEAYQFAIKNDYRFFSYGDASLWL